MFTHRKGFMFKGIVSRKALAAVVGGSLLMAGCGGYHRE